MACIDNEILGVKKLILFYFDGVELKYPDISKPNEIDIINNSGGYVIDDYIEIPKWKREAGTSANYTQNYMDYFTFALHGIDNDTPAILKDLREYRAGFMAEIQTVGGKSYVFPSPVFVSEKYVKENDSRSQLVTMTYRVPTNKNRLTKLNTLVFDGSFILVGDNQILGDGNGKAIVSS